ncbi:MAG: biosynthetic-type acetolactate synthase large subunit [Verrucomicrobiae bacterium]|nr:biosynthetic-type acetolactate synthase large subunit [Verrucomicrobiae bacterium]
MNSITLPRKSRAAPPPPRGRMTRGADIIVQALEREGVEVVFAYPGGTSMEIHQSLTRSKIRVILPRHEQGEAFAAEGYARASGRPGVCMATSGPGATNLVTGIADAYMDSIPMVAITGQVPNFFIGKMAFQETDVVGLTLPIVKHSYLVLDINDIPRVFKEAFHLARTGRPGPVLIDIPKNVQQMNAQPVFPDSVDLPGYAETPKADPIAIQEVIGLLAKAKRPLLYCGGGIISGGAHGELLRFAERTHIPVATTLMGIGGFPETHPLALKWLGMHGTVFANNAANEADLLLAIGVRFDDRVTGKVEKFCEHGTIVHIEIDPSEIGKNKPVALPILSDVKDALRKLNAALEGDSPASFKARYADWHRQIAAWKKQYPLAWKPSAHEIPPQQVIRTLYEMTKGDAIITTGVGQHQMWTGQFYDFTKPRTFLTSAGLGAMGFGYPAALGAKVACPNKQVIDIDGDGSFQMNIQELATAHIEKIAAKAIILNNRHLGMVMQWEDRFYRSNRGNTFLADPSHPDKEYPDFVQIARGFNIPARKVTHPRDLRPAIRELLDVDTAYVLDVRVPYTEHVLPMIPSNRTYKDVIIA